MAEKTAPAGPVAADAEGKQLIAKDSTPSPGVVFFPTQRGLAERVTILQSLFLNSIKT